MHSVGFSSSSCAAGVLLAWRVPKGPSVVRRLPVTSGKTKQVSQALPLATSFRPCPRVWKRSLRALPWSFVLPIGFTWAGAPSGCSSSSRPQLAQRLRAVPAASVLLSPRRCETAAVTVQCFASLEASLRPFSFPCSSPALSGWLLLCTTTTTTRPSILFRRSVFLGAERLLNRCTVSAWPVGERLPHVLWRSHFICACVVRE